MREDYWIIDQLFCSAIGKYLALVFRVGGFINKGSGAVIQLVGDKQNRMADC